MVAHAPSIYCALCAPAFAATAAIAADTAKAVALTASEVGAGAGYLAAYR